MTNQTITSDRIIREAERLRLTSISRSQAFQLERRGLYPKRIRLGSRSVGWSFNSIMNWIESRQAASQEVHSNE